VDCIKLFLREPEVMQLKIGVVENVAEGTKLLEEVKLVKQKELLENKSTLVDTLKKLKDEFQLIVDDKTKNEMRQEIQLKLNETKLLIKEIEEEKSRNEPLLVKAKEIHQIAAEKVAAFRGNKPQKLISLSKVINEFINDINSASSWQLIASKTIIKTIGDLESASISLNLMLIESYTEHFGMEQIVNSPEF
jgi:tRNA uridine 5-carbamoylmethylation protein Kti12